MRQSAITVFCLIVVLTGSQCEKEPLNGHLKLTVTYPEAVVENDSLYFIQVPADGAEARLYDKDSQCWGYRDAMIDVAWIGDDAVYSLYAQISNEKGEVVFNDIPAGEYYLVVFARQLYKYTEKYIEVKGGDTLKLAKDFTASLTFNKELEPWDYELHPN